MMWTISFRMLSVLTFVAFVSISTVQSRSNGLTCISSRTNTSESCSGGKCVGVWESAGIGGLFFCAKSLRDFETVPRRFPSLQKIATTSEKVTIAVNIDLDGTTVKIGGTIDPSTILKAMASTGTSLDFKSNDKYDQVTMIEKLSGVLSANEKAYGDLTQIRLCSGRPQKCTVHNASYAEEVNREYLAKIVENKKVTTTFGKALKFESSVQGDFKNLLEKAKKNEIVDMEIKSVLKVENSKLEMIIQGNTEKIPLSVWLDLYFPSSVSIQTYLMDLKNCLTGISARVCIGTECFHAGVCSTNLCNTKKNLWW